MAGIVGNILYLYLDLFWFVLIFTLLLKAGNSSCPSEGKAREVNMARALRHIFVGMGHLFDFSGFINASAMRRVKAKRKKLPSNALDAFHTDFVKVGSDMQKAFSKYQERYGK
ncbi:MAG: hypothetical protein ACOC43_12560 [Desulfohalobiaceae bacterium]